MNYTVCIGRIVLNLPFLIGSDSIELRPLVLKSMSHVVNVSLCVLSHNAQFTRPDATRQNCLRPISVVFCFFVVESSFCVYLCLHCCVFVLLPFLGE